MMNYEEQYQKEEEVTFDISWEGFPARQFIDWLKKRLEKAESLLSARDEEITELKRVAGIMAKKVKKNGIKLIHDEDDEPGRPMRDVYLCLYCGKEAINRNEIVHTHGCEYRLASLYLKEHGEGK